MGKGFFTGRESSSLLEENGGPVKFFYISFLPELPFIIFM